MPNEIDSTVTLAKLPTSSSKKRKASAPNAYPPPPPPPPPPVNNPYYQKFFKDYWDKYQAAPVPPVHGRSGGATAVPTLPPMVMPPPAKKVPATRIPNSLPQEEYPMKTDRETYVLGTADDMTHLSEKQCYTRSRLCKLDMFPFALISLRNIAHILCTFSGEIFIANEMNLVDDINES